MWIFTTFIQLSAALHLLWNTVFCMAVCNNAEYEIKGRCCDMCDPGKHVYKHCDDTTSTACVLCSKMTYTDSPNGLQQCVPCSVCDPGNGLRVKQACTNTSDTVCEPLPGHYCINEHRMSCSKARKHSTCSPGQYINQTGTAFIDTVCVDCPTGSCLDNIDLQIIQICKLHTKCESFGGKINKPGTKRAGAEMLNNGAHLDIVIPCVCVVVLFSVIVGIIIFKYRRKYLLASQDDYL